MGLSRSERALTAVRWLAKETGKTHYQIGEAMGYKSRSGFSQAINGKKNLPGDFTERLVAVDGRINPDFLDGKSGVFFDDLGHARNYPQSAGNNHYACTGHYWLAGKKEHRIISIVEYIKHHLP